MKLLQLQEAGYSGKRTLKQMMQFFWLDEDLSDGNDEQFYFPTQNYIVRNEAAHGECNEVWWIKFNPQNTNHIGIMYFDEHFDWISDKEFVENFIVYEQKKVF